MMSSHSLPLVTSVEMGSTTELKRVRGRDMLSWPRFKLAEEEFIQAKKPKEAIDMRPGMPETIAKHTKPSKVEGRWHSRQVCAPARLGLCNASGRGDGRPRVLKAWH